MVAVSVARGDIELDVVETEWGVEKGGGASGEWSVALGICAVGELGGGVAWVFGVRAVRVAGVAGNGVRRVGNRGECEVVSAVVWVLCVGVSVLRRVACRGGSGDPGVQVGEVVWWGGEVGRRHGVHQAVRVCNAGVEKVVVRVWWGRVCV